MEAQQTVQRLCDMCVELAGLPALVAEVTSASCTAACILAAVAILLQDSIISSGASDLYRLAGCLSTVLPLVQQTLLLGYDKQLQLAADGSVAQVAAACQQLLHELGQLPQAHLPEAAVSLLTEWVRTTAGLEQQLAAEGEAAFRAEAEQELQRARSSQQDTIPFSSVRHTTDLCGTLLQRVTGLLGESFDRISKVSFARIRA